MKLSERSVTGLSCCVSEGFASGSNIYMSQSLDFGENWSKPAPTELVGQPWPIAINKETFAVVAVDRAISQMIKLYLTDNGGRTFDASEPVVIYNNTEDSKARDVLNDQLVDMSNWFYGLPSGICLSDGSIMLTYYAGDTKKTDIHWCKVRL